MIREICVVGIFCAVLESISPERSVSRVMGILSSVIMMLIIIKPLSEIDMEKYAQSAAFYNERAAALESDAQNMNARLNRIVIEEEYKTYIMDKALDSGYTITELKVGLQWDTQGYWVPCAVNVRGSGTIDAKNRLCETIEFELGVPQERQVWE